jgi:hypothetical protein
MAEPLFGPEGLKGLVRMFRRVIVVAALSHHGGNVTHAARDLGITRNSLWRIIRLDGIPIPARPRVKPRVEEGAAPSDDTRTTPPARAGRTLGPAGPSNSGPGRRGPGDA